MSILSYKAPTEKVPLDDTTKITVRGFSSKMLSNLLQIHYDELEIIFKSCSDIIKASGSGEDFALRAGEALFNLINAAPEVVGTIIALSLEDETGTPDELTEAAMKLPISVQVEVVSAIAKLTMKDVGAIKKMFGELKGQIGVVAENIETTKVPKSKPRPSKKKAS